MTHKPLVTPVTSHASHTSHRSCDLVCALHRIGLGCILGPGQGQPQLVGLCGLHFSGATWIVYTPSTTRPTNGRGFLRHTRRSDGNGGRRQSHPRTGTGAQGCWAACPLRQGSSPGNSCATQRTAPDEGGQDLGLPWVHPGSPSDRGPGMQGCVPPAAGQPPRPHSCATQRTAPDEGGQDLGAPREPHGQRAGTQPDRQGFG